MPNSDHHLEFKKLDEKLIYDGYRKIIEKKFALPNGKEHSFEIMHVSHGIAIVVAFDKNGDLILVKQYRPGPEQILVEFPGGKVELGEENIQGVKRELFEETGYITDDIKEIGNFYSGAYSDGLFTVFLAKNCVKTHDQKLDHTEFIEVLTWSQAEFEAYYRSNIPNGHILLAYFLAKPYF